MPILTGASYSVAINGLKVRNSASTSGGIITSLNKGSNIQVVTGGWNYANVDGYYWAKITLGNGIAGYVAQGDSTGPYLSAISAGSGSNVTGFPASYQPYLKTLRAKYPNWTFIPLNTGLDWATAVSNELGEKSAVPAPTTGWVAAASSSMIAQPLAWVESGTWYRASRAAVEYYMNPCNFLSETGIFQFEQLSFNPTLHTAAGIQALIAGTFMAGNGPVTYVDRNGVTQILNAPDASVEAESSTITRTGAWTTAAGAVFSGGATARVQSPGAEMTFKVTGNKVTFVGAKNAGMGSFSVYVDGATTPVATISNAASTLSYQVTLGSVTFTQGTHTILLRTTSSALVHIDRIDVYGSPASVAPVLSLTASSTVSDSIF